MTSYTRRKIESDVEMASNKTEHFEWLLQDAKTQYTEAKKALDDLDKKETHATRLKAAHEKMRKAAAHNAETSNTANLAVSASYEAHSHWVDAKNKVKEIEQECK